jgi:hypothetical protein
MEEIVRQQRPMTADRKARFLGELRMSGNVYGAARAATPWAQTTRPISGFYDLRRTDPEFKAAWDTALDDFKAAIDQEIVRRAVDGYETSRTGDDGKTTTTTHYSDSLLIMLAKRHCPEYRDKVTVDADVATNVKVDPAAFAEAVTKAALALRKMAQEQIDGPAT